MARKTTQTVALNLSIIEDAGRAFGLELRGGDGDLEETARNIVKRYFKHEKPDGTVFAAYLRGLRAGFAGHFA